MGRIYGYARISRKEQSIDRQIRNIQAEYPDAKIVAEAFTGTRIDGRRELEKLLKVVKGGDTIVFDSVSRMSRNAEDGIALYEQLYNAGVQLVFLKEHYIDTATYEKALSEGIPLTGTNIDIILSAINEYLKVLRREQIVAAFGQAEKEVSDLHQRTKEGIETARLNGKQIGQKQGVKLTTKKSTAAKSIIRKHSKDFDGTLSDTDVITLTGLSRNTYYKYKREMRDTEEPLKDK